VSKKISKEASWKRKFRAVVTATQKGRYGTLAARKKGAGPLVTPQTKPQKGKSTRKHKAEGVWDHTGKGESFETKAFRATSYKGGHYRPKAESS